MRKPTEQEINEFVLKLGITPNAYIGDAALKYALQEYCEYLSVGKGRPLMTALYIDVSNRLLKLYPNRSKKTTIGAERNIRAAIDRVWKSKHTKTLDTVFKYYNGDSKPSNTIFISTCASYLMNKEVNVKEDDNIYQIDIDGNMKLPEDIPENIKRYIDETIHIVVKKSVKETLKYLMMDEAK